jgi:hypothetical protein
VLNGALCSAAALAGAVPHNEKGRETRDKNKINVSQAIEMLLKSIFALQHVPRCILPV